MIMEKGLEKFAGAPAFVLDKTLEKSKQIKESVTGFHHVKRANKYWQTLGPGLTTGAADDDPSGIATYSQTGAQYGFQLLWLAAFTFPFMAIIQEMCARIGLVTGRGLAANIRRNYPAWVIYVTSVLLLGANTFNLGADLGAMAKATQLLLPQTNFGLLLSIFAMLSLGLQIFTTYERYARYLKFLALLLLSYVLSALSTNLNFTQLFTHAVIPSITFSKEQIFLICGILGTTISPY
ncbi:MAG: Nramp family divalent metal transporter, partial [Candidatus Paceibacterales bacterium]